MACPLSGKSKGKGNETSWAIVHHGDCCGLLATYDTGSEMQRNRLRKAGWSKMVMALGAQLKSLDLTC